MGRSGAEAQASVEVLELLKLVQDLGTCPPRFAMPTDRRPLLVGLAHSSQSRVLPGSDICGVSPAS